MESLSVYQHCLYTSKNFVFLFYKYKEVKAYLEQKIRKPKELDYIFPGRGRRRGLSVWQCFPL